MMFLGAVIIGGGRELITAINACTDEELLRLPSYQSMAYITGLLVNRRVMSFLPPVENNKSTDHRLDMVDLETADTRLSNTGTFQAAVLERGRMEMKTMTGQQSTVYDSFPEFSFLDLDWSTFDFSMLGVGAGQQ